MGNHLSCVSQLAGPDAAYPQHRIKFFNYHTGALSELDGHLTAAEAMIEFPSQFLCSLSRAAASGRGCGRRICATPADDELQAAELYLLLPMHRLNSRFSMEEVAFFTSLEAAQKSKKSQASIKGAIISQRKVAPCPAAATLVSDKMLQGDAEGTVAMRSQSLRRLDQGPATACIVMGAAKNRICRSKSWMPKLETVDEFTVAF